MKFEFKFVIMDLKKPLIRLKISYQLILADLKIMQAKTIEKDFDRDRFGRSKKNLKIFLT